MSVKNIPITQGFSVGGFNFNGSTTLTGDVEVGGGDSVPAAQPGTLTLRTDNNTGELTMTNSGHGITTGARLDIYWSGGCRRGMVVGTVAGLVVPIDLGSGDNLPVLTTAIVASVPQVIDFQLILANLKLIAVGCDCEAQYTFLAADLSTESWTVHLTASGISFWYAALGAIPLAGATLGRCYMSHADTTAAHQMNAGALIQSA